MNVFRDKCMKILDFNIFLRLRLSNCTIDFFLDNQFNKISWINYADKLNSMKIQI